MLSSAQMKKMDPSLEEMPEEDISEVRVALYESAQLAFDVYWSRKYGSKYPIGLLTPQLDRDTL